MTAQAIQALGGLGLFLLGMIVLTEGLRALAGDAVHRVLFRFTKSPATGALTGAVRAMAAELLAAVSDALDPAREPAIADARLAPVDRAVDQARRFAERIRVPVERIEAQQLLVAAMHAIDHLDRLDERVQHRERIATLRSDEHLTDLAEAVRDALTSAAGALRREGAEPDAAELEAARDAVRAERQPYRRRVLAVAPSGTLPLAEALQRLDAMRWLHRTTYHAWRIVLNLTTAGDAHRARAEIERDDDT
jgi:phosphate:Na+ symporter